MTSSLPSAYAMHSIDRQTVLNLEQVNDPTDADIALASGLIIRYENSQSDLFSRLRSIAQRWGFTRDSLMERARGIWQSGYKPQLTTDIVVQGVGSGADVEG